MILTLTANPSIDRTVELSTALTRGTLHRATHVVQEAGGKGINVSRALAKSGMLTLAILPGDDDDPVLAGLRTAFLPFRNLPIGAGLRTNTAITEPDERGGLACRASARCGAFHGRRGRLRAGRLPIGAQRGRTPGELPAPGSCPRIGSNRAPGFHRSIARPDNAGRRRGHTPHGHPSRDRTKRYRVYRWTESTGGFLMSDLITPKLVSLDKDLGDRSLLGDPVPRGAGRRRGALDGNRRPVRRRTRPPWLLPPRWTASPRRKPWTPRASFRS